MPTDYCGNMIYENGVLKQILVDGGYVTFSGTTPNYFYYLKDHLGNNRVVLTPSGTPLQVNHYYPFGGLFGESTGGSTQRFMYNSKEFDRTHGLDWYDYGARHMSPDVGRFTTIDPMAENYYSISPYAYCANNPVKYVDLHGDSICIDEGAIMAIYNGLEEGTHVSMKFNNGVLDPASISEVAKNTEDFFLRDLYEIATDKQMVELHTDVVNTYVLNGQQIKEQWTIPYELNDYDLNFEIQSLLKQSGEPLGKHIQGNLGQTLYPNSGLKRSTNGNIQININGRGNINAQSIGIAHEFGHVILHLRRLPSGHRQSGVDSFVYGRASMMSKRLGYDY